MHSEDIVYQTLVLRQGGMFHLVNFPCVGSDSEKYLKAISDAEPEHRFVEVPLDRLDQTYYTFLEGSSPILKLSKSFYESLDSDDAITKEMAAEVFITVLKEHIDTQKKLILDASLIS